MQIDNKQISCNHTFAYHFYHGCDKEQKFLKRIFIATLRAFTFLISLALYKIFNPNIAEIKYSEIGKEAINFAYKKLLEELKNPEYEEFSKDTNINFLKYKFPPKNKKIGDLALLFGYYTKKIQNKSSDEWLKTADTVLKIGYAITSLTLDELHLFSKDPKVIRIRHFKEFPKEKSKKYARILTVQGTLYYV
jgi:hypothetical protein